MNDIGEAGDDCRLQALVERIQAAYEGETLRRVLDALTEELCEALLAAPRTSRACLLEDTLEIIRKYVMDAD